MYPIKRNDLKATPPTELGLELTHSNQEKIHYVCSTIIRLVLHHTSVFEVNFRPSQMFLGLNTPEISAILFTTTCSSKSIRVKRTRHTILSM